MTKTVRVQEREQRLYRAAVALAAQPGATAYLLSVAADMSVAQVMGALDELAKEGRARCVPDATGACWWPVDMHLEKIAEPEDMTGTGDRKMTAAKSPAAKARARYLTAAKRSLKLIAEGTARAGEQLAAGEIPSGSFAASVDRYHDALTALTVLAEIEAAVPEAQAADDGTAEVSREDLQGLIKVLLGFGIPVAPGTPMARLQAAAEGPPWDTQAPAPEPSGE